MTRRQTQFSQPSLSCVRFMFNVMFFSLQTAPLKLRHYGALQMYYYYY